VLCLRAALHCCSAESVVDSVPLVYVRICSCRLIPANVQDSILLYTAALNVTNQNRWDAFGRFTEPVFSKVHAQLLPASLASRDTACGSPVAMKGLATALCCLLGCRCRLSLLQATMRLVRARDSHCLHAGVCQSAKRTAVACNTSSNLIVCQ
jgi:hypothetical protein